MKGLFDIFEKLSLRMGRHNVFRDFLNITICALSAGEKEEEYFKIISNYEKPQIDSFAKAFSLLVAEMDNNGEGLKDVLGLYYDEFLANHAAGQFFTPDCVCELISELVRPRFSHTVLDCACGSGRMLLNAAKSSRFAFFYGADISELCAKMTLINLCLNGLFGEVAWMDSLKLDIWGAWKIDMHVKGCPYIREIPINESYFYPQEVKQVVKVQQEKPLEKKQLLLFE